MKRLGLRAVATAALDAPRGAKALAAAGLVAGAGLVMGSPAAYADALSMPAMSASISNNANPISFDGGPIGKIYVGGNVSGFGDLQDNSVSGDRNFRWDVSNAQVFVQKTDGLIQFYLQAGDYDILSLGAPTFSSGKYTSNTFTALPVGYLKLQFTDAFSVQAGKLPTLIGDEYTFDFENLNIERGLLWNQEPAISRGVQANYTLGPLALNVSFNDGYYSDKFDWVSGLLTWTIDSANTLAFAGGGSTASDLPTSSNSFVTPPLQQNSSIFNVIYTYSNAPWTVSPYVQYSSTPRDSEAGIYNSANSWGGALLVNYNVDPNWNLALRGEYISTAGQYESLLYGPRSNAWSLTFTPTFSYNVFYARAEISYVSAGSTTPGYTAFGTDYAHNNQARGLIEAGVQF
jgi:hypothetical protein